jgi:hypothetical protein
MEMNDLYWPWPIFRMNEEKLTEKLQKLEKEDVIKVLLAIAKCYWVCQEATETMSDTIKKIIKD